MQTEPRISKSRFGLVNFFLLTFFLKYSKSVKNVSYHIKEYQKIISDLRNEIFELKQQMTKAQKMEGQNDQVEDLRKSYDSVKVS